MATLWVDMGIQIRADHVVHEIRNTAVLIKSFAETTRFLKRRLTVRDSGPKKSSGNRRWISPPVLPKTPKRGIGLGIKPVAPDCRCHAPQLATCRPQTGTRQRLMAGTAMCYGNSVTMTNNPHLPNG